MNDNTRSYQLKKTNKTHTIDKVVENRDKSTKLIWEKPDSWIPSEGSSMRLASFAIPYSVGTGDLSVIQLGGDGGGLKSNVNRWRGQLNLGPIDLFDIEKDIVKEKGQLNIYKTIQIINQEVDSAFLCAIIPYGNYTIFVKLSLKPIGIMEVKDDFITFCSSLKFSN
jgi:hypothetical protein